MSIRKFTAPAALALALALGGAGLVAPAAFAQAQAPAAAPQAKPPEPHHHFDLTRHVDARIAYMKAYLGITPAQEAAFDRVAQAMRDNAKDMSQAFQQRGAEHGKPMNAVEQLEMKQRFAAMHARHSERFLAAFKPLYASLTDAQKQAADQLLAPHWGHRRHG